MLVEFLAQHRSEILALTEDKTLELAGDHPSSAQLKHGLPIFYEQVIDIIRRVADPAAPPTRDVPAIAAAADRSDEPAMARAAGQPEEAELATSAGVQGQEYRRLGYTLSHVVHAYGAMCQAITEVAGKRQTTIDTDEFRALNRCLDVAIAGAVTSYEQAQSTPKGEPLSAPRQEMRNVLGSARAAFHALKDGTVGVGGSTGRVLEQSLARMADLLEEPLAARWTVPSASRPS